jgi:hypothetical protein
VGRGGRIQKDGVRDSVVDSYDGNIPHKLPLYDILPLNTAIGRNDMTPDRKTAANKLS